MFHMLSISRISPFAGLLAVSLVLAACGDAKTGEADPPVRGLRVFEVTESAATMTRRYPSVVQPADETPLSFEISGQLSDVKLEVGVQVSAGDILLRLDRTTLQYEVQQARAALEQSEAGLSNARTDFNRKQELLKSGNVTMSVYDGAEANLKSAEAQAEQARQQLAIAQERLQKTDLRAPFDGVISSVDAKSYANVSPGQTVLSLYSENAFEVEFSVPATVINALHTGDTAQVEITDLPSTVLKGRIKELGSRAGQVSAFPAVVILEETHPGLKAGMAAEVSLDISLLIGEEGYLVPVHCFALEQSETLRRGESIQDRRGGQAQVYVYDAATSTVRARMVQTAGVRDNMIIVSDGLVAGEIIAAAGVSYLHDGQKVRLLGQQQQ